jgi:hypothetical protein
MQQGLKSGSSIQNVSVDRCFPTRMAPEANPTAAPLAILAGVIESGQ